MKKSKQTKSNEQFKILRMIARDFELERKFKEAIDTLYGILLGIATVVAVAVGAVIGIKMMTESTEGKAKVKEALAPFVIGCIVVFGAFTIWKIVIEIGYSLEDAGQTAKMLFITRA